MTPPAPTLVLLLATTFAPALRAQEPSPLPLAALPDEATLAQVLWDASPALAPLRARLAGSAAAIERAQVLPNPQFTLNVGNLALGETNPPGLNRWTEMPNASLAISELVEINKREPRARAATADLHATQWEAREALRGAYFDLRDVVASAAEARLTASAFEALVADADRLAELEASRSRLGDTAATDADRARLEAEESHAALLAAQAEEEAALAECAQLVARPCTAFPDAASARAYLDRRLPDASPERRAELAAFDAHRDAALARRDLALATGTPDPTFQLGYLHDRFVVSGNQRNALFLGVSLPLPVLDAGEADAKIAQAQADESALGRAAREAQIGVGRPALEARAIALQARLARLTGTSVPLARALVGKLEASLGKGGTTLQELLLARRSLGSLAQDEAHVAAELARTRLHLARIAGSEPPPPPSLASP